MTELQLPEESIFLQALELQATAEREDFLDQACLKDTKLRAAVDGLLRASAKSGDLLDISERPGVSPTLGQSTAERAGTQIGLYKILQRIGEGGMGIVYMAEQTEPVQRRVALKIIKPGMDTRQVIARFAAEKQALALMDHANIARVLDAGSTEDGRPYFVMELVHGTSITKYCDDNCLTPRQRLELFVPVCQAIQHAHQKGIIHRDIKPSNVMITVYDGKPVPKVIDFGVAKATEQKLTDQTLFTQYGTMIGTLEYMSPEQAEMSALGIDTRSDIFSLGVLLYELLTGSTPLNRVEMKEAALGEILRLIKEEEPPKPSTRLSASSEQLASISAQRQTEPAKLSKLMQGDLDWIVMKSLEKDRNRRYETANGFAADVQRYLADEPVLACPPSASYRFRKFARRNKPMLITAALCGVMLLAAVGTAGWAVRDRTASEAEFARERQLKQTAVEHQVNMALKEAERLQEQTKWPEALAAARRAEGLLAGGGSDELRECVHHVRNNLEMVLRLDDLRAWWGDHPGHDSQDRAYARVFLEFGIDVKNLGPAEVAERIRRYPSTAIAMAAGLDEWAMVLRDWVVSHPDQAHDLAVWNELLEAARLADPDPWRAELRQLMGREDLSALRKLADSSDIATLPVQSLQLMGNALIFGGDGPACVAWLRKAHQQHPGDTMISFDLAFHLSNLPSADKADVLRFAEAALAARPQSASMYSMVGSFLERLGRHDEAVVCFRRAVVLKPDFSLAHSRLGIALAEQGKLDEAVAAYMKAIELDPNLAGAHNNLGVVLNAQGRLDEGIAAYREAIVLNPKHAGRIISLALNNAAWHLAAHPDPKARNADRAVELAKKAVLLMPDAHWNTLGVAHYRAGDWKAAISALERSLEVRNGGDSYDWLFLAMGHWQLGNEDEARNWYDQAVHWMEKNEPKNEELRRFQAEAKAARVTKALESQEDDLNLRIQLGNFLREAGDFNGALAEYSEVITRNPKLIDGWTARGDCYARWGECAKAAEDFSAAIKLNPDRAASWTGRAAASLKLRQWEQAVSDYSEAIERAPQVHTNWFHRGHAYLQLAEWDKAAADFGKVVEGWPDGADGWYLRCVALAQLNRPDEAMAELRQAIEKGFNKVAMLNTDPKLAPLRTREDFGKLLEVLEQK